MANPLDRTWYNTLVDDNGSGTTGTIWNKAAVDSLLDAVDASLATVVDKSGAGAANLVAIFTDADTVTATPAVGVDLAGGLKLDSPSYAYVQLNDQSQPTDGRLFRLVASGGKLQLVALSAVGAVLGQVDMLRDGRVVLNAGQLTFPTTQKPSTDPYTLDDYRKLAWTPAWGGTSGASGQTYTIQEGFYTKIGNRIFASGRLLLSAVGTITGNLALIGLPHVSAPAYNPGSLRWTNGGGFTLPVSAINGIVTTSAQYATMTYLPAGGAAAVALLPPSALQAGTDFFFDLTYVTAA